MKLVILALLLLSLSACENCTMQPADNSNKNTDTKIENKVKDILDKQTELTDFFKNVVGEDISPTLNQIKNAKNASEQEAALKIFAKEINTKTNEGLIPFHLALDRKDEDVINLMIKYGADINEIDKNKMSPLKKASLINDEKLVETLINAPSIDLSKNDTFKWAIKQDNLKIAKMLLEKNIDVNALDDDGYTYLHLAVMNKRADILKELLNNKSIEVNKKDKNEQTPLHYARDLNIAKILIESGADVNITNKFGETPLNLAIRYNEKPIENLLKNNGAKLANKTEKKENQPFIDFISTPFTYSYAVPTIGMSTTKQYDGFAPKAPFIADYNGNAVHSYMAIKLLSSFSKNLPDSIKEELSKNKIEENKTDIFLVIQGLSRIGSKTQIKAHGWADPDAPYESNAPDDRLKRNFLYGVYESDKDISQDVKINKLKEFEVYTHLHVDKPNGPYQIVYSPPQGAIINIPDDDRSNMSFYSLVIDNNNPDKNNIRAAVTLHWLLLGEIPFQREIYQDAIKEKYNSPAEKESERRIIKKHQNIGELIKFWQEESFLKDSSLVKKLTDLITDQDK